jgi:hypothetical protein
MRHDDASPAQWPLRVWAFTALGGLAGLLTYWVLQPDQYLPDQLAIRSSGASFVIVLALLLGLLVERTQPGPTLAFTLVAAAVAGLTTYWAGAFGGGAEPWKVACAGLGVGIATPLFQSWRGAQRVDAPSLRTIPYAEACHFIWTDVFLVSAAGAFTGLFWIMVFLLSQLFKLIGIRVIADLLGENWMMLSLTGAALGAGIGLLRDRTPLLDMLVRSITTILSLLAPLLALGLAIFVLAVPITGMSSIWGATRSTSATVLGCIIAALVLANAVIGGSDSSQARHPVLRTSAAMLCLSILPLGLIAALSIGLRIDQHGLTPDRLWAVVFAAIATAYGIAYLSTLLRRRMDAARYLRIANLRLAMTLTVLSLLLASPVLNFGAISTRNQVARLYDGRTVASQFDWGALRFDFGATGEAAVRRLAKQGRTADIRGAAAYALKQNSRSALNEGIDLPRRSPVDPANVTIVPRGAKLPTDLFDKLSEYSACGSNTRCLVRYDAHRGEAIIVTSNGTNIYRLEYGQWRRQDAFRVRGDAEIDTVGKGLTAGNIEVRQVRRRQVFINGIPVGDEFE